tara:strand:- start:112 stop:261 length:150 start_codon:yes stop_codon:yes gene_type:complete
MGGRAMRRLRWSAPIEPKYSLSEVFCFFGGMLIVEVREWADEIWAHRVA